MFVLASISGRFVSNVNRSIRTVLNVRWSAESLGRVERVFAKLDRNNMELKNPEYVGIFFRVYHKPQNESFCACDIKWSFHCMDSSMLYCHVVVFVFAFLLIQKLPYCSTWIQRYWVQFSVLVLEQVLWFALASFHRNRITPLPLEVAVITWRTFPMWGHNTALSN